MKSVSEILERDLLFTQVFKSTNATASQLHLTYRSLTDKLSHAQSLKKKTLLFVYYRGGGGLDSRCLETYAVLPSKEVFAIEHMLTEMAKIDLSYILGLIDCPRKMLKTPIDDGYTFKEQGRKNLILIFGCKRLLHIESPTFWSFASHLKRKRNMFDTVVLPEALLYTKMDESTEEDQSVNFMLRADKVFECSIPCLMMLGSQEEQPIAEEPIIKRTKKQETATALS